MEERGSMMRLLYGVRRVVSVVLVGVLLSLGVGCYGSFPLTHFVYTVNGSIEPGLLRQVVFWVFLILPVYEVGALGDVIIFNLLEFWTGADFDGFAQSTEPGELQFTMEPAEDGRTARVSVTREGDVVARARFVRVSDRLCEARSPEGDLLGRAVRTEDGGARLEAADGTAVTILSGREFDTLVASAREGSLHPSEN
ncbi:MAG: DUF3332 family protein [Candidatus Brocadiia bacterium]